MLTREKLPFEVGKDENFYEKLNEWIGDVFYDILPEAGFDLRDEQIFMAFQIDRAIKEKKVIFAEAGVGTGKTFAYLLYAICYARYTGKPAIIACADETLIEQLVKKEGDIEKLSRTLHLNVDVRLAKSKNNYLCLQKLEEEVSGLPEPYLEELYEGLPPFVYGSEVLQKFYPYGDRKDYPTLNDEQWKDISWDYYRDCFTCDLRHRCGQTLSRDYYRKATELIVCSQDFFMEHVWTIDARVREGQLPLLPTSSCVIFDEGHLVEFAAQKALTHRLKENMLESLLTRLLQNDVREEFTLLIEQAIKQNTRLFDKLFDCTEEIAGSQRLKVDISADFIGEGKKLYEILQKIGDELVFESEMYTIDDYDLKIVDEYLDVIEHALRLLFQEENVVTWAENEDVLTLVVMPRAVEEVLREKVFSNKIPYIFSSATMSDDNSFEYIANSVGVDDYLSFSVPSPFEYEENMTIHMPTFANFDEKMTYTLEKIKEMEGKTLVLFRTEKELELFKEKMSEYELPYNFLYEGEAEISQLVSKFQQNVNDVLCSVRLWEGLDIPGASLSQVIIWSLPFPPNDPVLEAKCKNVENPFVKVEIPYMLLRLRQGIGRLIRTYEDKGEISILLNEGTPDELRERVESVLPVKPMTL